MDFRQALLERHGASFGRDSVVWEIASVDVVAGEVRFRTTGADGHPVEAMLATTVRRSPHQRQIVDRVSGPFGEWQFVSQAFSNAMLPDTFIETVAAMLDMDFEPHDAVCLARAWREGDTEGPANLSRFPEGTLTSAPLPGVGVFRMCAERLGLYAVVPDPEWVERLVPLGIPTIQLRLKSDDPQRIADAIARAASAVRGSHSRLFINDHWREAVRQHRAADSDDSGIYGIHLGQEDLADADINAICASRLRLGVSTHGFAEMLRILPLQPSYLALGAVYPTTTKTLKTAPQGLARLQAYVDVVRSGQSDLPLVAIGGIDAGNMEEVLRTGVRNVAVVRALTEAGDLPAAMQRLRALAG